VVVATEQEIAGHYGDQEDGREEDEPDEQRAAAVGIGFS